MGKLDLKKQKSHLFFLKQAFLFSFFFLKCLSLINILRIVDKKYYILVCLPICLHVYLFKIRNMLSYEIIK